MEYIPDKFDVALMLLDEGELLAVNQDEAASRLYRYKEKLYVIWHTHENTLDKIEIVNTETAKEMFKKYNG